MNRYFYLLSGMAVAVAGPAHALDYPQVSSQYAESNLYCYYTEDGGSTFDLTSVCGSVPSVTDVSSSNSGNSDSGSSGSGAVCDDFKNAPNPFEAAQDALANNPRLDGDGDGIACDDFM